MLALKPSASESGTAIVQARWAEVASTVAGAVDRPGLEGVPTGREGVEGDRGRAGGERRGLHAFEGRGFAGERRASTISWKVATGV
jgi:hypothetical protein